MKDCTHTCAHTHTHTHTHTLVAHRNFWWTINPWSKSHLTLHVTPAPTSLTTAVWTRTRTCWEGVPFRTRTLMEQEGAPYSCRHLPKEQSKSELSHTLILSSSLELRGKREDKNSLFFILIHPVKIKVLFIPCHCVGEQRSCLLYIYICHV